jgi:hypothetical protein
MKKIIILLALAVLLMGFSLNAQAALYDHFLNEAVSGTLWNVNDGDGISSYDAGGTGSVDLYSQVLDQDFTAMSTTYFTGDFDVVMRYENWNLNAAATGDADDDMAEIGLAAMTLNAYQNWVGNSNDDPSDYIYMARGCNAETGVGEYFGYGVYGGVDNEDDVIAATSDVAGLLRIARINDDFTTYYSNDDGATWNTLYIINDKFTDPIVIGAHVYSGDASLTEFGVDIDYVDVCSQGQGQVPVPEPGIMVLLGSLITGLFGVAGVKRNN